MIGVKEAEEVVVVNIKDNNSQRTAIDLEKKAEGIRKATKGRLNDDPGLLYLGRWAGEAAD